MGDFAVLSEAHALFHLQIELRTRGKLTGKREVMSNGPSISIGLGARNLRDRDWLSKSDPYIVISRPSTSGSFQVLRKSETKKNCLNPDWADFLFNDREVGPHEQDLRLKFEIFDNDYNSADQLLGVTHLSLKQLEAAATLQTSLKIGGSGNGKVNAGNLVVRSFNRHGGQQSQFGQAGALGGGQQSQLGQAGSLGGGHQGQLSQSGPLGGGHQGHIGQTGPYRGQPGQGGELSVGYPSQPVGYPSQSVGYPSQPTAYHSQPAGYPYQPVAYPALPVGYPQANALQPVQGGLPYPAQPAQGVPGVFYPTNPHISGSTVGQSGHQQLHASQPAYPPPAFPTSAPPLYPSLTPGPSSFPGYPSAPTYNAPNDPSIGPGGFVSLPS